MNFLMSQMCTMLDFYTSKRLTLCKSSTSGEKFVIQTLLPGHKIIEKENNSVHVFTLV